MTNFTLRPSSSRGIGQGADWLDSRFSFSFADYHDPAHMGFRSLRVINEDRIAPSGGFPMHPHRDMEIVTYVMAGALAHKDSMGNGEQLGPNEIQYMSAGTGVVHSEFNPSPTASTHLLQIWLLPAQRGIRPDYAQRPIELPKVTGKFGLLLSGDGRDGSIRVQQDADLWLAKLAQGETARFDLRTGRGAWAQMAQGAARFDTMPLSQGDGASWTDAGTVTITATADSDILLFDLV